MSIIGTLDRDRHASLGNYAAYEREREHRTTNEMVRSIAEQLEVTTRKLHLPVVPLLMAATVIGPIFPTFGLHPPIYPRPMDFFTKSLVFSQERALGFLGFMPEHSFGEGVFLTAEWHREEGYL